MADQIIILDSARKRGYEDDDLLHVVAFAVREYHQDDELVMFVGADQAGRLMEVGTITLRDGKTAIVHAMRPPAKRYRDHIRLTQSKEERT